MGVADYSELFLKATAPDEAPARVGSIWVDTTAGLVKRCTSVGPPYVWAEVGGGGAAGAVTREGGNTTEATTTSTSAVDLLTAASLSIATNVPIWFVVAGRKTTGAAAAAGLGLKINATVTGEASSADKTIIIFTDTNAAAARYATTWLGPRITDYNLAGTGLAFSSAQTTAASVGGKATDGVAQPIATITDLVIRGITASASQTIGADECHVYSLAVS